MSDSRQERISALTYAVTEWAARSRKDLQKQIDTSKRILQGRTGSEHLVQSGVQASTQLVVDSIQEFLSK